jgi:hypothetical protein
MPFSLFALAVWVFLQSATAYGWIEDAPKLIAFFGMVFVIAVVLDAVLWARGHSWFRRGGPAA